jgi:hypothetical protein
MLLSLAGLVSLALPYSERNSDVQHPEAGIMKITFPLSDFQNVSLLAFFGCTE